MKAILVYNLPSEAVEHRQALDAGRWESVVWELDRQLRDWLKYGNEIKSADEALEKVREKLRDEMANNNLEFSP